MLTAHAHKSFAPIFVAFLEDCSRAVSLYPVIIRPAPIHLIAFVADQQMLSQVSVEHSSFLSRGAIKSLLAQATNVLEAHSDVSRHQSPSHPKYVLLPRVLIADRPMTTRLLRPFHAVIAVNGLVGATALLNLL